MLIRRCGVIMIGLALIFCAPVSGQEAGSGDRPGPGPSLEITGSGGTRVQLGPASLDRLPRIEQSVAFLSSKGEQSGRFEGVLLWELLLSLGLAKQPSSHADLQRTFVVTGRDGYSVAFSLGEIIPDLGGRAVMVAERVDGRTLSDRDGLRLIVPGDKRGARSVRGAGENRVSLEHPAAVGRMVIWRFAPVDEEPLLSGGGKSR
ncbi:hypothetical protein ACWIGM_16880 [Bosea sp. NPDC055332]